MSRLGEGFNSMELVQISNFNFKFNSSNLLSTDSINNVNSTDDVYLDNNRKNKKIKLSK